MNLQLTAGPVWVKADKELPPNIGSPEYHFRVDGFHKVNGNFHYSIDDERMEGEIVFTVQGNGCHEDYVIPNAKFSCLEWLDESQQTAPAQQLFTREQVEEILKSYARVGYPEGNDMIKSAERSLCEWFNTNYPLK